VTQPGVGVRGHAGQMHTPRPELDDEGDVERAEPDRLDGEEVGRQDPACLVARNFMPFEVSKLPIRSGLNHEYRAAA
jgi:hypothetical protein